MDTKSFVVEYEVEGKKKASRVLKGIKVAEQIAQARKSEFGGTVWIIGFDSTGHRTLEQRV